jgi:hypothetical protein
MLKMLNRFESTLLKYHFSLFVKYSKISLANRQQQRHSNIFKSNELWTYLSQKNRTRVFRIIESVSIDNIRVWLPFTQGIDSARIHRLAESIPWNRLMGSFTNSGSGQLRFAPNWKSKTSATETFLQILRQLRQQIRKQKTEC